MKKIAALICIAALAGCRSHPITPEQSWADYSHYYRVLTVAEKPPAAPPEVRSVRSSQLQAVVESLKQQGYVTLGTMKIDDGTDITYRAVQALAQKLNADIAVWSVLTTLDKGSALPNPDMGIVGVDYVQHAHMEANRPDQTAAEQMMIRRHEIWMMGTTGKK